MQDLTALGPQTYKLKLSPQGPALASSRHAALIPNSLEGRADRHLPLLTLLPGTSLREQERRSYWGRWTLDMVIAWAIFFVTQSSRTASGANPSPDPGL